MVRFKNHSTSYDVEEGDIYLTAVSGNGLLVSVCGVKVAGNVISINMPENLNIGNGTTLVGKNLVLNVNVSISNLNAGSAILTITLKGGASTETYTIEYTITDEDKEQGLSDVQFTSTIKLI